VCQYGVPELADSQVQRLGRAVICGSLADGSARRNFLNDLRFSVLRAARCAATGLCGGSESGPYCRLAEGEELGSNLLHVLHRIRTGQAERGSFQGQRQAVAVLSAPMDQAQVPRSGRILAGHTDAAPAPSPFPGKDSGDS
jgi:hypothetical protein